MLLMAMLGHSWAGDFTPAGLWKTFDDDGKASGQVQIEEHAGVYSGRVVGIFNPEERQKLCESCSDERKNQPVMGMIILKELTRTGEHEWGGGHILDPKNGKVYRAKITLSADGNRLDVRGFIGFSLLGRTQSWLRELNPSPQK
jgi:uncharacterized protein (DUF2147 family)